jgi:excinuclease ABC subunit A
VKVGEARRPAPSSRSATCTLREAPGLLQTLQDARRQGEIAAKVVREIGLRLKFLNDVGLNYLSLDRSAETLSGGESQRIRLASQIGSGLTGVMYVLDEPSIGLHQRDNDRLIDTLKHLRDIGNSVLVVEHDEDMMRAADHMIDMGPGAGVHGGRVMAQGTFDASRPTRVADRQVPGARCRSPCPSRRTPWLPDGGEKAEKPRPSRPAAARGGGLGRAPGGTRATQGELQAIA